MKKIKTLAAILSFALIGQCSSVFAAEKIDFSTMEETDFKSGPFKEYAYIFELKDKISEKFMHNTDTEFKVRAIGTELDLEIPSNSQVEVTVIDEQTEDIVTEYVESLGYTKDILIIDVNPDFIVNFDILSIPNDENAGDINADGKVDLTDLSELSLAIIGDKTLTESQIKAADIDENGKADLPDLARIKQYLSKVVTSLR